MKSAASLLIGLFFCSPVVAQHHSDTTHFVYNALIREQRKAIAHLELMEAEKQGFWKIYDDYSRDKEFLELQYLQMIRLSTDQLYRISTKEATILHNGFLENDMLMARLRKQYFNRFCQVISPAKAGHLMTLDNSIRMLFRFQLQASVSQKTSPVILSRGSLIQADSSKRVQ